MSLSKSVGIIEKLSSLNLNGGYFVDMISTSMYFPDWLDDLRGEFPLLKRDEFQFITSVLNLIIQQVKSKPNKKNPGASFTSDKRLVDDMSVMKNNFDKVVQYLKKSSQSKDDFVSDYPRWRYYRDQTISKLINIAEAVDINQHDCAEQKKNGSSLSLIGGLLCLATGAGAVGLLGKALIGIGTLGSVVASVKESDELKKMIKEAEKIIQVDKEYSEKLWNWISDVSDAQEALDTIEINVDPNLKKVAEDLNACYKKKSTPEELKMVIGRFLKSWNCSPEISTPISEFIGILMTIFMLYERYNQAFEVFKCYKALSTACNLIAGTLKIASGGTSLTSSRKSIIFTGVALDAINIILASNELESKSKEAEEIRKAAEKLKEEAEVFQKLYYKVIHL